MAQREPTTRKASYAASRAAVPALTTLGLEEADPEDVFELQRKEGAGAFGRVFRACYKADRTRLAALKVIPVALEAGQRGEDIESVRREIQFLRECDHPNVVGFHGAYYKDGALWVAMEHCAGGSVGDIRRGRVLSEREISVIMRGALHGLAYLHARRKIHRDVKGGNILLTAAGQVKIADFGVSAQLRDTLSRRGSFVGTPYWMSPELIQDSDYDCKADIWSLGITAIELADQKPPLFDEHPMRVLIQIPRNPPPQVAHPEAWSPAFLDFLRFCLRKDPAERPTALECMQHEFIRREAHIEHVFASSSLEDTSETTAALPIAHSVATPVTLGVQEDVKTEVPVGQLDPISSTAEIESTSGGSNAAKPTVDDTSSTAAKNSHAGTSGVGALPSTPPPTTSAAEKDAEEEVEEETQEEITVGDGGADEALSEASSAAESDSENEAKNPMLPQDESIDCQEQPASSPLHPQVSSDLAVLTTPQHSEIVDGLLDLTVDESFDLEKETEATPTEPVPSTPEATAASIAQQLLPQQHTFTLPRGSSSLRHPPTEFKLLPVAANSPAIRSAKYPSGRFESTNDQPKSPPSPSTGASTSLSKRPPKSLSPSMAPRQNSFVSKVPTPSIRSSWLEAASQQVDPLASIDAAASARINRLLSSFSMSASTSSFMAAMQAYSDSDAARPTGTASSRQSFDWRTLDAGVRPATVTANRTSSHHDVTPGLTGARIFVGDPFHASHDVCVRYNSLQAQFEGAPASAEWVALHQQFGIALAHMRCRSSPAGSTDKDDQVPALLRMLRRELVRRDGLRCKYIYRVSPVQEEVQHAKAAINRGSFEPTQIADPHVYAGLIKLWLRELPTLLLDALSHDDISAVTSVVGLGGSDHRTAENDDKAPLVTPANFDNVDEQVVRTLNKLGARERAVLDWLLTHMLEVNAYSSENHMTLQSLATVLAPNVYCVSVTSISQENAATLVHQVVTLLCVLLAWKRTTHGVRSPSVLQEEEDVGMKLAPTGRTTAWRQPQPIGIEEKRMSTRLRQSIADPSKNEPVDEKELENASLETVLRRCVDCIWDDLQASGITTVEFARQEHVLRRVFYEFQRSMLELVAQYSKRSDERAWADALVKQIDSTNQLEATTPPSLEKVEPWVRAGLCFTDFRRLLEREQVTRDKLKSLQARFGGPAERYKDKSEPSVSDPSELHRVLHHLAQTRLWQQKTTKNTRSNLRGGKVNAALINGSARLVALGGGTNANGSSGLTSKLLQMIADVGEHQPATGNLLAGIGELLPIQGIAGERTINLQRQLLGMVQSSVLLRHLEHQRSSTT